MHLAYYLLGKGFAQQGAFEHLHWFRSGQVQLLDPNEMGPRGSLLVSWLKHGELCLPSVAEVEKDPWVYASDRGVEALAIWLLEQGANPWVEGEEPSLMAWRHALTQGHCALIRALANHPSAPAREVLEAVGSTGVLSTTSLVPPVWFAHTNQVETLRVWAELGFDVNLKVGQGGPGSRAITPEFLTAWAQVGGKMDALEWGRPLPKCWERFPADKKIKMEQVWQAHQPARELSTDEAIGEFLNAVEEPRFSEKALAEVRFLLKSLQLKWSSVSSDGRTLQELVQERFFNKPAIISASLARTLFRDGDPALYLKAVVTGVEAQITTHHKSCFPSSIASVLTDGVLGAPHDAWALLAQQWLDHPLALLRVLQAASLVERDAGRDVAALLGQWVALNPLAHGKALANVLASHTHSEADFVAMAMGRTEALENSPLIPWFALYVETRSISAALSSQPEKTAVLLGAAMERVGVNKAHAQAPEVLSIVPAFFEAIQKGLVSDMRTEAWVEQVTGLARQQLLDLLLPAPRPSGPKPRF